jgi:putative addiction module killer protein
MLRMSLIVRQTKTFSDWHVGLRDERAQRRIAARINRVRDGLFGDTKSLGTGLFELRVDYGPGYRLYYEVRGGTVLLLLAGGNKSSQQRDIDRARELMKTTEI